MNNLNHVDLLMTAEDHTVELADLATDPKMQMRVTMDQETIEQYAENIDAILAEKPIDVVLVDTHGYETWYVVDGFHRYHAAQLAKKAALRVRLMRGTYEQALQFAMSANWKNGLRPKKDDAARSIAMLLVTAPDFGFDSKQVIPWLATFGIPKGTARDNTKELRGEIDAKRDDIVMLKHGEGLSSREIEEATGVNYKTAQRIIEAGTNERTAQMSQEEQPVIPTDENESSSDCPWFDDEDFDTTPAINPADAFQKALSEHEAERQETTRQQDKSVSSTPNVSSKGDVSLEERIKEALRAAGIYEDHTKAEVNKALFNVSQGN